MGILKVTILTVLWVARGVLSFQPTIMTTFPKTLGRGGGRITIIGKGFAEDQFNYESEDAYKGNEVLLVNQNTLSVEECETLQFECSTTQIVCEVGNIDTGEDDNVLYKITVYVDGVKAKGSFGFRVAFYQSPIILEVSPFSGPPGSIVTFRGSFHANRYEETTVDKDSVLLEGIRFGPRECDLMIDGKVTVTENEIRCQSKGTYVGNYEAKIFVEPPYGTSITSANAFKVSVKDEFYLYQAYPVITSVTPNTGSIKGGTRLTLHGLGFDPQPGKTLVQVAGETCAIQSISDTTVTCITSENFQQGHTVGGRGLLYEQWRATYVSDLANVDQLHSMAEDHISRILDGAVVDHVNSTMFSGRLSGYFISPHDGYFQFQVRADDDSQLYLSPSNDPAEKILISAGDWSHRIHLRTSQHYYFEAVHRQGSNPGGKMHIKLFQHKTPLSNRFFKGIYGEKQKLSCGLTYTGKRKEEQVLDFSNIASKSVLQLYYKGRMSESFEYDPAGSDNKHRIEHALASLMLPGCEFHCEGSVGFSTDFENENSLPESDKAFCGSKHVKATDVSSVNGNINVTLNRYPHMCFAYKGDKLEGIYTITYKTAGGTSRERTFNIPSFRKSKQWTYSCTNVMMEFPLAERAPGMTVVKVVFPDKHSHKPSLIDTLSFSSLPREVSRNEAENEDLVDAVVTATNNHVYRVTFDLIRPLEKYQLIGAVKSGNTLTKEEVQTVEAEDRATFRIDDQEVICTREVSGLLGPRGTWSLSLYDKKSSGLPYRASELQVKEAINSLIDIPVQRVLTSQGKTGMIYFIWFAPGTNYPPIRVDTTQLQFEGKVNFVLRTLTNGGLETNYIGGDFFKIHKIGEPVTATVNRMTAVCHAGTSCEFTHSNEQTPAVTQMTTAFHEDGATLEIQGNKFSEIPLNNEVTIGSTDCTVTSSSATQIKCSIAVIIAGNHSVSVNILPLGLAKTTPTPLIFTQPLSITSISPAIGSIRGGTTVIVAGKGFPDHLQDWENSNTEVHFGDVPCRVTSTTLQGLVCITEATGSPGSVVVTISVNGVSATAPIQFEYSSSFTPIVSSVLPITSPINGGAIATITGNHFGDGSSGKVTINDEDCSVDTWSDTEITCELPASSPGIFPVQVLVTNLGYADTSGASPITYEFSVTSMVPTSASLAGGTTVKLTGVGFGEDCMDMAVHFSEDYDCDVTECTPTSLTCITRKLTQIHKIVNNGRHITYGLGFEWSPEHITIEAGDYIRWMWDTPLESEVSMGVYQARSNKHYTDYDPRGFSSGDPKSSGTFLHHFEAPGHYFYTGPQVFPETRYYMTGSIDVLPPNNKDLLLVVQKNGFTATHDKSSGHPVGNIGDGSCSTTEDTYTECGSIDTDGQDISLLYMSFQKCSTPSVSTVAVDKSTTIRTNTKKPYLLGHYGDELIIIGEGFGSSICQNTVKLGDDEYCQVTGSTSTSIKCTVSAQLHSFRQYPVSVSVLNRGRVLPTQTAAPSLSFVLFPRVTSVSPKRGSIAGGFSFHIHGTGFVPFSDNIMTEVFIGNVPCLVRAITFSEIVCIGGTSEPNSESVVQVTIGGQIPSFDVEELFDYTSNGAADLTNIQPTVLGIDSLITIHGNNFGTDPSQIKVALRESIFSKRSFEINYGTEKESTPRRIKRQRRSPFLHADSIRSWMIAGSDRELERDTHRMVRRSTGEEEQGVNERISELAIEKDAWGNDRSLHLKQLKGNYKRIFRRQIRDLTCKENAIEEIDTEGRTWGLEYRDSEDFNGNIFVENEDSLGIDLEEFQSFEAKEPDEFEASKRDEDDDTLKLDDDDDNEMFNTETFKGSVWDREVDNDGNTWNDEMKQENEMEYERKRSVQVQEDVECIVITVNDNSLSCKVNGAPTGVYHIVVKTSLGDALSMLEVEVPVYVFSVTPSSGSVYGGSLLTLKGSGFSDDVQVSIGSYVCEIKETTADEVKCVTSRGSAGSHPVEVVVQGNNNRDQSFEYDQAITAHITTVTPESGKPGDTITISGSSFGNNGEAKIGESSCEILSYMNSLVTCKVPNLRGDTYKVQISVTGVGLSNDKDFSIPLTVIDVSPNEGSSGGGTLVTLSGSGFSLDGEGVVTICGTVCPVEGEIQENSLRCRVPVSLTHGPKTCAVTVTQGSGISASLESAWSYVPGLTPDINLVTPKRGGTAGGTKIIITGTGFASSGNKVSLNGSECIIKTESKTAITCETEPHRGAVKTAVTVDVPGKGYATAGDSAEFYYIDKWSSPFTWGGHHLPAEKQYVIIPKGMTIMIDTDTPILSLLLIDGGHVIFDDDQPELSLNAEYILILKGGSLSIGTEQQPYQNIATINLYGHVQSTPLPVYGAKVLAVRDGTLDLHGRPIPVTWTRLSETAAKGTYHLKLMQSVTWQQGDIIVIATTGETTSMKETETASIASVSEDGFTITLDDPLQYTHISIAQVLANTTVETRGEVGLLTRNVRVQGNVNQEMLYAIPECEEGFKPGQFSGQTCFNGKFGEEIGGDQFGATIMMSAAAKNTGAVTGRIEYVEVSYAGQAFRLGRYPIHYHLNGDVSGNYVRGCSIHNTFNRAITIHAVNNLLVEKNVVYNVMGHAVFTEDGIEEDNIIQYNLVIFARGSSSLLNSDITPAAYWIVNPLNIVRHNAAAGCTHFGFWYRIQPKPSGPSRRGDYCITNLPLNEFNNNTAHSLGLYGLWIFGMKGPWTPKNIKNHDNTCLRNQATQRAVFNNFQAWRCERGAETVNGDSIIFNGFVMVDNSKAGIEMVLMKGKWGSTGPGIRNSLVIGGSALSGGKCSTKRGIVIPRKELYNVNGVTFVNFNEKSCVCIEGCSQCDPNMGGYSAQFSGLTFINSMNIVRFKWRHEHWYVDADGSLTGEAPETKVTPQNAMLPPTLCNFNVPEFSLGVPGAVCDPSISFHGMAITGVQPGSLMYLPMVITTDYGSSVVDFKIMSLIQRYAWEAIVLDGYRHQLSFEGAEHITNVSYTITLLDMNPGDSVMFSQQMKEKPDRVAVKGIQRPEAQDGVLRQDGDWTWNEDEKMLTYMVTDGSTETKRNIFNTRPVGIELISSFKAFRCSLTLCGASEEPPFIMAKPKLKRMWSNDDTWSNIPKGYAGHGGVQPIDGEDLLIPSTLWVVADVEMPSFGKVYIDGILEINDSRDNILNATNIIIRNGQLIAGKDSLDVFTGQSQRFTHKFTILLRGDHNSTDHAISDHMNVGAKSLAVFGKLDLHGADVGVAWTKLEKTAEVGSGKIILKESVGWSSGQEVVITTTSFETAETEKRVIVARSDDGKTLTLDVPLKYQHLGVTHTSSDGTISYDMRAEVGLLTRNIRIEGQGYQDMDVYRFGGRVMVGEYSTQADQFRGTAKLSNVEFFNMGQAFYTKLYNPGYSLSFINVGDSSSYVKKCAFNHNFMTAIYVSGSNNINFQNNIIFHTVDTGIKDAGSMNEWRNNLATVTLFSGTYLDTDNVANLGWDPTFSFTSAENPLVVGNIVAGSERSAFRTRGDECESSTPRYQNNEAHGMLHGITMLREESGGECRRLSGYYLWRAYDYGVYANTMNSIEIDNVVLAECNVGFLPMMVGPDLKSHKSENQFVKIRNSVIIGRSSIDICHNLKAPKIAGFQSAQRAQRTASGGISGINWGCFITQFTRAPKTSKFHNPASYPALYGNTYLNDVTFVGFGKVCGSAVDAAIIPNIMCEDINHPIINSNARFIDVHNDSRVFIHRPILGSITPADCVDMDCDGFKKTIIQDMDGSIIGNGIPGTIVPQSDYEWDMDRRRGLGDYRIPPTVIVTPEGKKIPKAVKAPYNGIYGTDNCTWIESWQAYTCHGIEHVLMIIESMDRDTEDRRLSPVALVVDPGREGYIDLLNGPQDVSWCFGYNCQKRISTFYSIATLGLLHEITFTSTPPETMRLHLRSDDNEKGILVNIFFPKPQRYNVYINGRYKSPTNADFSSGKMVLRPPRQYTNPVEYIPDLQSNDNGDNYYDRYRKLLWIVIKGSEPIDVVMEPVFAVRFGMFVDVNTFYEKNVTDNIAYLLNIPTELIMTVDVVRETNYKRSNDGFQATYIEMEIEVSSGEVQDKVDGSSSTFDQIIDQKLKKTNKELADLVNCHQSNDLNKRFDSNIVKFEVEKPPLSPNDPIPLPDKDTAELNTGVVYSVVKQQEDLAKLQDELKPVEYEVVYDMVVKIQPGGNNKDNVPLQIQPVICIVDKQGLPMHEVGVEENPWKVRARLQGSVAVLTGDTTVNIQKGVATFTNLAISLPGETYKLLFDVVFPADVPLMVTSDRFAVTSNELTLKVLQPYTVQQNKAFDPPVQVLIWDSVADRETTPDQQPYTWECLLNQRISNMYTGLEGHLTGNTQINIDPSSTRAAFDNVAIDELGRMYMLSVVCMQNTPTPKQHTYNLAGISVREPKELSRMDVFHLTLKGAVDNKLEEDEVEFSVALANAIFDYPVEVSVRDINIDFSDSAQLAVDVSVFGTPSATNLMFSYMTDKIKAVNVDFEFKKRVFNVQSFSKTITEEIQGP